jgi:hypothetical protein
MKVIKQTENNKDNKQISWIYKDTCPLCGSVIEYNDLDVILRIGNRRFFIKCGACYNILELNSHTHKIIGKEIKF